MQDWKRSEKGRERRCCGIVYRGSVESSAGCQDCPQSPPWGPGQAALAGNSDSSAPSAQAPCPSSVGEPAQRGTARVFRWKAAAHAEAPERLGDSETDRLVAFFEK